MKREQRADGTGGLWREAATVHWIWITTLSAVVAGVFAWRAPEGPETPERGVRTPAVVVLVVLIGCGLRVAHSEWKARKEALGKLKMKGELRDDGWKSPAQQAAEASHVEPAPEPGDPRARRLFLAALDEFAGLAKSDGATLDELTESYRVLSLLTERTFGTSAVGVVASAWRPVRDQVRDGRTSPGQAAEQMLGPFRDALLTGKSPDLSSLGETVPEWDDWRERVLFADRVTRECQWYAREMREAPKGSDPNRLQRLHDAAKVFAERCLGATYEARQEARTKVHRAIEDDGKHNSPLEWNNYANAAEYRAAVLARCMGELSATVNERTVPRGGAIPPRP